MVGGLLKLMLGLGMAMAVGGFARMEEGRCMRAACCCQHGREVSFFTRTVALRGGGGKESYHILVAARIRPMVGRAASVAGKSVVLPLHQRLKLIQSSEACSPLEAKRLLWESRGGKEDPWQDAEISEEEGSMCTNRSEGFIPNEADRRVEACMLWVQDGRNGSVLMCCPGSGVRPFSLDHVHGEKSKQEEVYEVSGRPFVDRFLQGQDACIMAYGQTGSGKTFTIFGPEDEHVDPFGCSDSSGVVPRAIQQIFKAREQNLATGGGLLEYSLSMVEVYGDEIIDLLGEEEAKDAKKKALSHVAVLRGQGSRRVQNLDECARLLQLGSQRKTRAETAMNLKSSRAHTVIIVHQSRAAQDEMNDGSSCRNVLCLVDLGGAEQVSKSVLASGSRNVPNKGDRIQEAIYINLGLLALKNCVRALVNQDPYVPYSNSKLTLLLRRALGGNCVTSVIVTCACENQNAAETIESLRFGEAVSAVNNTIMNSSMVVASAALQELEAEISAVEEAIRHKERWETVDTQRPAEHQMTDEEASMETVTTTRVVGAEEERKQLERLLLRKHILTGAK